MNEQSCEESFEDRLRKQLLEVVNQNTLKAPVTRSRTRRSKARVLIMVSVVMLIAAAVGVLSTLRGSRTGLAQAAVIRRISEVFDQPNVILHVKAIVYGVGYRCLGEEVPVRCIGRVDKKITTISANPAKDPIDYKYEQWIGGGQQEHTVYSTGDETASRPGARLSYDPSNRTLTTITEKSQPATKESTGASSLPDIDTLTPLDIRQLYNAAVAGSGEARLVGDATLDGKKVYELHFDAAKGGPALLLYVDARSFLPVRAVMSESLGSSHIVMRTVTTFVANQIQGKSANEGLLHVSRHRGIRHVTLTPAQLRARD